MLATINRTTAIEQLTIEHDAVRDLIDTLTDAEMTRPDTIEYGLYPDQALSFKDLLAHLITYEAFTLAALDRWQAGEKHHVIDDMQNPRASREIHYGGIAVRADMTLQQVINEWEDTQSQLMQAIMALSEDDWRSPAPFATERPLDLGGMLEIILVAPPRPPYRHLPVHIPDVPAYIRKLRAE